MKLKFSFLSLFFSLFVFAQNQSIDELLLKRSEKTDSLQIELKKNNIQDEQVEYFEKARTQLKSSVNEVLKLENFNNKVMQKTLLKPLTEYYEAFNVTKNGKETNTLRFGFESKDDFIYHYKISEALLLSKLIDRQYVALINDAEKNVKEINAYITRNLKRLGISRAEYDKLSDNDRKLLEKKFD